MAKASEWVAQVLGEAGIEYVFGIPGAGSKRLFDALCDRQDTVHTIMVRHEQAAAIMADAIRQAQVSGKPAVVDVAIDRAPNPDEFKAGSWQ